MSDSNHDIESRLNYDLPVQERIDLLIELARIQKDQNRDRALGYANEALKLSEADSYKLGLLHSHHLLGLLCINKNDTKLALDHLNIANKLCDELNYRTTKIAVNHSRAVVFRLRSVYEKAIEVYHQNLKLCEQENNVEYKILGLESIGSIYIIIGDLPLAFEYLLSAVKECVASRVEFPDRLLNDLGVAFRESGDTEAALEYFYKVFMAAKKNKDKFAEIMARLNIADLYGSKEIKLFQSANDIIDACFVMLKESGYDVRDDTNELHHDNTGSKANPLPENDSALYFKLKELYICKLMNAGYEQEAVLMSEIGDIYLKCKNFEKANEYYLSSLELYKKYDLRTFETNNYIGLGNLYLGLGEPDRGFGYLQKALRIASTSHTLKDLISVTRALYLGYKKVNDLQNSLLYHEMFYDLTNEMHNLKLDKQIKTITILNEIEKAERERAQALQEKEVLNLKNIKLEMVTEELRNISEKKIEQFDMTAHDLKNPLFNISVLSRKIKKEINRMDREKLSRASEEIDKSSKRMFDIIYHLSNLNTIENRAPVLLPVNPMDLLNTVISEFKEHALSKNIEMICMEDKCPDVLLDRSFALLALENLVSNAVKYSPLGKKVYMNIKYLDGILRFEVKDEGPGIHVGDKSRLFNKYSRLSSKPTGDETSTGLGLYIVKRITDILKGRVWCESNYGDGSTFIVEFPALIVPVQND